MVEQKDSRSRLVPAPKTKDLAGKDYSFHSFRNYDLSGANLVGCKLSGADLSGADLSNAKLQQTKLIGANLYRANLHHANLDWADLTDANLQRADLRTVTLVTYILHKADLRGVRVDGSTNFRTDHAEMTKIDRRTLELLQHVPEKQTRMLMDSFDDVSTLRQTFSGIMRSVQVLSLLGFLAPYMWFLCLQSFKAHALNCSMLNVTCQPMIFHLYHYAMDGKPWWLLLMTIFLVVFNFLRIPLVWKTNQLEMKEKSTGLPAIFNFTDNWVWHWLYRVYRICFVVNLVCLVFHIRGFLMHVVPVLR